MVLNEELALIDSDLNANASDIDAVLNWESICVEVMKIIIILMVFEMSFEIICDIFLS